MKPIGTSTPLSTLQPYKNQGNIGVKNNSSESAFKPSEAMFYTALSHGDLKQIEHCFKYYTPNSMLKNLAGSDEAKPYHFLVSPWVNKNAPEMAKLIFTHDTKPELDKVFKSNLQLMVSYGMDQEGYPIEEYLPVIASIAKHCPEISIADFKDGRSAIPNSALAKIQNTINEARRVVPVYDSNEENGVVTIYK